MANYVCYVCIFMIQHFLLLSFFVLFFIYIINIIIFFISNMSLLKNITFMRTRPVYGKLFQCQKKKKKRKGLLKYFPHVSPEHFKIRISFQIHPQHIEFKGQTHQAKVSYFFKLIFLYK